MKSRPQISFRDFTYRVYRLRRQIAVLTVFPAIGAGISAVLAGPGTAFSFPWWPALVLGLALVLNLAIAIRFPAGWIDATAISLTTAGYAVIAPLLIRVLQSLTFMGHPVAFLAVLALIALGAVASVCLLVFLIISLFGTRSAGQCRFRLKCRIDADPAKSRAAFFLGPDRDDGRYRTGPADPDGVFHIRTDLPGAGIDGSETHEIRFRGKILESTPDSQTTLYFLNEGENATTSVERLRITPLGQGALYEHEEVHDHFTMLAAIGWWMTDAGGDALTEKLDRFHGDPVRALNRQPQDTPLTWLAGRLHSGDPAPD